MAKTVAERQRLYRQRHGEDGERINMAVNAHSKRALERLARHHGISQRAMLERVLSEAESALVGSLEDLSAYYDDVTQ